MDFSDDDLPGNQEARANKLRSQMGDVKDDLMDDAIAQFQKDADGLQEKLEGAASKEAYDKILAEWQVGKWYAPLVQDLLAKTFALGYNSTGLGNDDIDFKSLDPKVAKWIQGRAFTSEKLQNDGVRDFMTNALQSFLGDGKTFNEFRPQIEQKLQDAGITETKPYHIETVFNTEQAVASNYGRYQSQMEVADECPLWEFFYVDDGNHQEGTVCYDIANMGGFTAPANDPIWATWYPPCHFNCRSSVNALTEEAIAKEGKSASPQGFLDKLSPQPGFDGPAWDMDE